MKPIAAQRLILKPMCGAYLESTHAYAADPENTVYMLHLPSSSKADTLAYLESAEAEFQKENPEFYEMAVFLGEAHIGAVSLYLDEARSTGELGWIIHKQHWGNGYAFEAAQALIAFAAEELGIRSFFAACDTENAASQRVMEKLGFERKSERGGRFNKQSPQERREYRYELQM